MIDQHVPKPQTAADVKELRLALVCYGGVSLAIYMHGITKEIHKLVRASEQFNEETARARAVNPFTENTMEHVYWNALAARAEAQQVRTRVVVDVIAGTSAGGINGICLAKALAGNRSQDALRQLWIEKGDIRRLLRLSPILWWKLRLLLLLVWPRRQPFLRGDEMCAWLHSAFEDMDRTPVERSLVPPDRTLELFVTMTDFHGYEREFPLERPRFVHDRTHRHVMTFRHDGQALVQFTQKYNHALAFAARATSSFPAAFPPITFADYHAAVSWTGPALGGCASEFFSLYGLCGADPDRAYFIDGGILNNYPFGSAIDAIQHKPAASEVDRRLLYIEPDPTFTDGPAPSQPVSSKRPSVIATALGACAGIPGNQPIIDDLARLAERNRIVERIKDIVQTSFAPVQKRVDDLLQEKKVALADVLSSSGHDVAALTEYIDRAAIVDAGLNYASYLRLRLAYLTDAYAALIADARHFPPTSYQAGFIANVLRTWAETGALVAQDGTLTDAGRRVLGTLDLGYHERRLRFIIAAFSGWYGASETFPVPPRRDLDQAKARVYQAIVELQGIVRDLATEAEAKTLLDRIFDPTVINRAIVDHQSSEEYLKTYRADLESLREMVVTGIGSGWPPIEQALYQDLLHLAHGWSDEAKRRILTRYLGFPYWDILVYPVEALANVGERDYVEVVRMSPRDATLLVPLDKEGKLKGVSLFHFGAFLERSYRENDYLWGRVDATEMLIEMLLPEPPPNTGRPSLATVRRALQIDAIDAVLAEDRGSLTKVPDLLSALDEQRAALRARATS